MSLNRNVDYLDLKPSSDTKGPLSSITMPLLMKYHLLRHVVYIIFNLKGLYSICLCLKQLGGGGGVLKVPIAGLELIRLITDFASGRMIN